MMLLILVAVKAAPGCHVTSYPGDTLVSAFKEFSPHSEIRRTFFAQNITESPVEVA